MTTPYHKNTKCLLYISSVCVISRYAREERQLMIFKEIMHFNHALSLGVMEFTTFGIDPSLAILTVNPVC